MTAVRIGIDRASCATNVLINNHADVGRQRETLIYAPTSAREQTFGVKCDVHGAKRVGVSDVLAWQEFKSNPNSIPGIDLIAMDKCATRAGATTAKEVRDFRRSREPIRLKTGERRAADPVIDPTTTFGRPSHRRLDDEIRYAQCEPGTKISSIIQGDFVDDWLKERLAVRARRAEAASAAAVKPRSSAASAKIPVAAPPSAAEDPNRKMKKFLKVKSKVAAMGYF